MQVDETQVPYLCRVYRRLASEIGLEATLKVYQLFGGRQINFPQRMFIRSYIVSCIQTEYTGKNIRELAERYDYSERWIREIVLERPPEQQIAENSGNAAKSEKFLQRIP